MTQLLTAWEKQVQDYEQQSGDKISDAIIKLGVVLHHLPDASSREHLLLNSRVSDTHAIAWQLRKTNSGHGENDLVRSNANGSEHTREGCCLSRVREERTLCEGLLGVRPTEGVGKERMVRKARKAKGKAQEPRMLTPRRKVLTITVVMFVTLRA